MTTIDLTDLATVTGGTRMSKALLQQQLVTLSTASVAARSQQAQQNQLALLAVAMMRR
jgi:hypothetical protein